MAKPEAKDLEGTSESFNCKTCVLRVSIHCEGCKRKVIKILHTIHGVHAVEIDRKQQKVTVTTNIDEQTLLKKLIKAGKHAEPWPESKPISKNVKEKQIAIEIPVCEASAAVHDAGKQKQSIETETPAKEVQVPSKNKEKCGNNGNAQVLEISKSGDGCETAAEIGAGAVERVQSSPEGCGDKSIAGGSGGPSGSVAVEASSGGGGEGRKKKKKGQRKEKSGGGGGGGAVTGDMVSPQTVPAAASIGSTTHDHIPSSNHTLPLNQTDYYPVHTAVSRPAYVASYNSAHPSSAYGPYYAAPPPYSYAYVHSIAPINTSPPSPPLPLAEQSNSPPSSPFDFFSEENPSGCSAM